MSDITGELELFSKAQAAIEPYLAGGIIERAIGVPVRDMDGIVNAHIGNVALLNAKGDTTEERPSYVFNPDTGLLINFAYRRSDNPDCAGFFADIVELDETGRPRQGVGVVNPFATTTGFVHVAVGENDNGFAPSHVDLKLDSEDITSIVPPSIETADLISMLASEAIPEGMSLEEFQANRIATQEEMRGRVQERQYANFRGTKQALSQRTDPNYHMIITDRDDVSAFETASREVGIFPIVIPARAIVNAYHEMKKIGVPDTEQTLSRFSNYVHFGNGPQGYRDLLRTTVPAFLTYDFEQIHEYTEENQAAKRVSYPRPTGNPLDVSQAVHLILLEGRAGAENIVDAHPFFSKLFNNRYPTEPDDLDPVRKKQHGVYEFPIDTEDAACMKIYTDWLRKVRLDFALTLYLRGLSKL